MCFSNVKNKCSSKRFVTAAATWKIMCN